MTTPLVDPTLQGLIGAAAGAASGFCYFIALRWNVGLFALGATPKAMLLLLARFAALAAVFTGLAKLGAFALLSGAAGLLVARQAVLRRFKGLP